MKKENPIEEQSNKKNNKSAVFKRIALCICIITFLLMVFLIISRIVQTNRHKEMMEELRQQVQTYTLEEKESVAEEGAEILPTTLPTIVPSPIVLTKNPYSSIFNENKDVVAWIIIPDTKIDLPIVQTKSDENYYLQRDINGKYNINGTLIMDTDSDVNKPSTNLIIHGHNMKSGEMFGDLDLYKDEIYAKEHEKIFVYFLDCKKEYQVIAVFYSQVFKKSDQVFKFYNFFQAENEEEFMDYYDNIKAKSIFDTGVEAEYGDELLTLSTCSYQVENGRFVVVAKKISKEELVLELEEQ